MDRGDAGGGIVKDACSVAGGLASPACPPGGRKAYGLASFPSLLVFCGDFERGLGTQRLCQKRRRGGVEGEAKAAAVAQLMSSDKRSDP